MSTSDAQTSGDSTKPVAYDAYGRPLYAHPPATATTTAGEPSVVYISRARDPHHQEISDETQAKHEESKRLYPYLNLSEGEYVISAIRRHPIGLISIWAVVALLVSIFIGLPALFLQLGTSFVTVSTTQLVNGSFILLLLVILAVLGGVVATVIYDANRFFLTNESIIQHIQAGLFSKKDQTISLNNVEDASYRQHGVIETVLNYGSIRLSTEGEETTYRFYFVANPEEQIRLLNDAVESFKNFRPFGGDSTDD